MFVNLYTNLRNYYQCTKFFIKKLAPNVETPGALINKKQRWQNYANKCIELQNILTFFIIC